VLVLAQVPANLDETLRTYARQGLFTLAVGVRLNMANAEEEVHQLHRKDVEKDLIFLGGSRSLVGFFGPTSG